MNSFVVSIFLMIRRILQCRIVYMRESTGVIAIICSQVKIVGRNSQYLDFSPPKDSILLSVSALQPTLCLLVVRFVLGAGTPHRHGSPATAYTLRTHQMCICTPYLCTATQRTTVFSSEIHTLDGQCMKILGCTQYSVPFRIAPRKGECVSKECLALSIN